MVMQLTQEDKVNYLSDLYHEDMRERKYQRRIVHSDGYFGEDEDLELPDETVDEETIAAKSQVEEFLSNLPFDERKLLEEYYLYGKTQQEISAELNLPQTTVSYKIKILIKKLQKIYR